LKSAPRLQELVQGGIDEFAKTLRKQLPKYSYPQHIITSSWVGALSRLGIDFSVPVAVRGTISFGIKDYREFVKLHRLFSFNLDDFQKQIRDAANRYIKDAVANAPAAHNIPVIQIESKTAQINDAIEYDLSERMSDTFGVVVSGVDIGAIEIDKSSEGYRQLMSVTKDIAAATAQAEAQAKIKDIHDKQRIEAENYEESLRIQREEGAYAQHMHTRTANFGAYQVEKQAEVGVAGDPRRGAHQIGHDFLRRSNGFIRIQRIAFLVALHRAVAADPAEAVIHIADGIPGVPVVLIADGLAHHRQDGAVGQRAVGVAQGLLAQVHAVAGVELQR
jgi:hypothetical protein